MGSDLTNLTEADRLRFWARVAKGPDCWIWTGSTIRHGYGKFTVGGKSITTHRYSWVLHNGEITGALHVLHRCDVTCCVNPAHLFLGNAKINAVDRSTKGRSKTGNHQGVKQSTAKLSDDDVRFIRQSTLSVSKLGDMFNINSGTISRIKRRLRWSHVQ